MKSTILSLLLFITFSNYAQNNFSNINVFGANGNASFQLTIDNREINDEPENYLNIKNIPQGMHKLNFNITAPNGKTGIFTTQIFLQANIEYSFNIDLLGNSSYMFYCTSQSIISPNSIGIAQKINENTSIIYNVYNANNNYQNNKYIDFQISNSPIIKPKTFSAQATDSIIDVFCNKIDNKNFDEEKLTLAKLYLNNFAISTAQFKRMMNLFENETYKLKFSKACIGNVYDKTNLYIISDTFENQASLAAFQRYVHDTE